MASFDVESLFTNIPLKETIDLCADILFYDRTNIDGITKDYFHDLLTICMSESLVLFDGCHGLSFRTNFCQYFSLFL